MDLQSSLLSIFYRISNVVHWGGGGGGGGGGWIFSGKAMNNVSIQLRFFLDLVTRYVP